jgi:arginyl-tRNA synthetase
MLRQEIKKITGRIIKNLYHQEIDVEVGQPLSVVFGDRSTNVAMVLKKNPAEIVAALGHSDIFSKTEVKNGFINFFISPGYLQKQVKEILRQKDNFGKLRLGRNKKVNVEFISANPTGPLTLGNGRGGFCGDVLANVLSAAGFKVKREYYVNDTGEQVRKLGHSVLGDEQAVYQGDYIEDLRKKIKGENAEKIGQKAADIILREMIKPTIKKMKINFDLWFSEKDLYREKETEKVSALLKKKGLSYEKEGAVWFRSTEFGDDKDRVLIKAGGESTYFLSDIAYLKNKFKRGFKTLFFFWGADHFGYINRVKAAAQALGFGKENIRVVIMQLVRLVQQGKEVRMSKRAGTYVTLDELMDEVGLDVARFFFLTRSPDTHLNFDLDLAKEQSEKNPVYYVQYAHARICSILRKLKNRASKRSEGEDENAVLIASQNLKLLEHPSELALIKQLIRLPEIIEDTAKDYQVQRLPQYAVETATAFHRFYRDCRVISDDKELSGARLSLVMATKIVLKNTLGLTGISAPEKM